MFQGSRCSAIPPADECRLPSFYMIAISAVLEIPRQPTSSHLWVARKIYGDGRGRCFVPFHLKCQNGFFPLLFLMVYIRISLALEGGGISGVMALTFGGVVFLWVGKAKLGGRKRGRGDGQYTRSFGVMRAGGYGCRELYGIDLVGTHSWLNLTGASV